MKLAWPRTMLLGTAAVCLAVSSTARTAGQTPAPFPGMLDEHPSIQYAQRPTTDVVSRLNQALAARQQTLVRDDRTGYLTSVLAALGVARESQLLVFSKTGVQRAHTGPHNPRALYFNESVIVGYIPGAPSLEVAAHDPQQGVVFYTLEQAPRTDPLFTRQTSCLTCHVSASTLDVPGVIDRSNLVDHNGNLMPHEGSVTVNHTTPHTQRWGGWFVTGEGAEPPYQALGHLGNLTATPHPSSGPAFVSNHVLIEWLNSDPEARGYLSPVSDHAALIVFDHQAHAMNLLTRLNWEARAAASSAGSALVHGALATRVEELVDYLFFVGEARPVVAVEPRPGFAEQLLARAPKDRRGRSLGELDLVRRLLRYSCSYMVHSEAFDGLPPSVKDAVYRRMFVVLSGTGGPRYAHLRPWERQAIRAILRETKRDLPADLR